ncbi:MAG: DUF1800 domain-containing protein [Bacteroidia bacterium]|nr:DUF1800 domain-containing protein [Bacteroidia bacterium]
MNRRSFFSLKPQKVQAPLRTHKVLSGLTPYSGVWGIEQVKHLLRRTMFGATKSDIDYFLTKTMTEAVTELLTASPVPSPPLNDYGNGAQTQDPDVPFGQTWVNAAIPLSSPLIINARKGSLRAWWVGNMLNQQRSIIEKLILFWHNHFAVEGEVIISGELLYIYQNTLRQNALGNFKTFTKQITLDPAMLRYLNGYLNSKNAPDENFARELQELFTVGKDNGSPFTEDDVKAAARILTGHRINPLTAPASYYFDFTKHDTGNKTFSAFYSNTVIQGQSGANGGNLELDALLDMIFDTQEVALHICRRLYNFFVYYKIDSTIETNIIQPLATIFRNNNYEILPVLETLFQSEHFYDTMQIGCIIKNPLDYYVGMSREFNINLPDNSDITKQYKAWMYFWQQSDSAAMGIGEPDNVSGFMPYYQLPMFHELWINSDTFPKRIEVLENLINGTNIGSQIMLQIDPVAFAETLPNPGNPDDIIHDSVKYLYSINLGQNGIDFLKSILLSGQSDPTYWIDAWNDYALTPVNDPNYQTYYNIVYTRLKSFYQSMMTFAEYQLS